MSDVLVRPCSGPANEPEGCVNATLGRLFEGSGVRRPPPPPKVHGEDEVMVGRIREESNRGGSSDLCGASYHYPD